MRSGWYRARNGETRLWLEPEDIEAMMEDELRGAALLPTTQNPVVNLETFIERYLGARLDPYADLEHAVLGQTEFLPGQSPRVLINRDLTRAAMDEDESPPGVRGRWRATLAHEAGHVVMHRMLFELEDDGDLFGDGIATRTSQRLMRCLKANVLFRDGAADWREVQANRGMAALLMPRALFQRIAAAAAARLAISPDDLVVGSLAAQRLAAEIAPLLEVSKQAARIRLETLGLLIIPGQARLGLA